MKFIHLISKILLISIIATICTDLWSLILYFGFERQIHWGLPGRWFGHFLQGELIFNIPTSTPILYEEILGWIFHYLVGLLFTIGYYITFIRLFKKTPQWYTALLFSWLMMIFPFLALQPAMGVGVAAHLAPNPWLNRFVTISAHTIFGLGLYLGYYLYSKLEKKYSNGGS